MKTKITRFPALGLAAAVMLVTLNAPLATSTARAGTLTVLTNVAAFAGATDNPTMLTFDGLTTPGHYWQEVGPWVYQGVTFYDPASLYVVNSSWNPGDPGVGFQFLVGNGGGDLTITPAAGTTAVSLNTYIFSATAGNGTVYLSDGSQTAFSLPGGNVLGGGPSFTGFVSTNPSVSISNIVLLAPNQPYLDTLTVAAAGPSLVGWWPGEGNALDQTTNHDDGTTVGAVAYVPGVVGQAFQFDGSDYVSVPNSDMLNPTNGITIMVWIKTASTHDYSGIIDKMTADNAGFKMGMDGGVNAGMARSDFGKGNVNYISAGNSAYVMDGAWHFLATTYDNTNAILYVDGVAGPTNHYPGFLTADSVPLLIGYDNYAYGDRHFTGSIDEPMVFNRALFAAEIAELYVNESRTGPRLVQPVCAGTNFAFSFQSLANQTYALEYNDDLGTTNWHFLEGVAGDGSLMPCVIPMTNGSQRFFRVRQP